MVWEAAKPNAGFSTGKPWLPVPASHATQAVDAQQGDPASMLEHYRRFLAFRRSYPAFAKGDIEFLSADGDALAFTRREGNERIVCAFNLGHGQASIDLGADTGLAAGRRPWLRSGRDATERSGSGRIRPGSGA